MVAVYGGNWFVETSITRCYKCNNAIEIHIICLGEKERENTKICTWPQQKCNNNSLYMGLITPVCLHLTAHTYQSKCSAQCTYCHCIVQRWQYIHPYFMFILVSFFNSILFVASKLNIAVSITIIYPLYLFASLGKWRTTKKTKIVQYEIDLAMRVK